MRFACPTGLVLPGKVRLARLDAAAVVLATPALEGRGSYTRLMESRVSDTAYRGVPRDSDNAPTGWRVASVEGIPSGGTGTDVAGTAADSTSGQATVKPDF